GGGGRGEGGAGVGHRLEVGDDGRLVEAVARGGVDHHGGAGGVVVGVVVGDLRGEDQDVAGGEAVVARVEDEGERVGGGVEPVGHELVLLPVAAQAHGEEVTVPAPGAGVVEPDVEARQGPGR